LQRVHVIKAMICGAGRKVRENVTDAIEKAKFLRMCDWELVPVAARSRSRTNFE
jgi:hypothetical protein